MNAKSKTIAGLCLLAALTTSGCFPSRMTYFKPEGVGARLWDHPCGGTLSGMEFKIANGASVAAWLNEGGPPGLSASLTYFIPDGASLRLISGALTAVEEDSGKRVELTPPSVTYRCATGPDDYSCSKDGPPTTLVEGKTLRDGSLFGFGWERRTLLYRVELPFSTARRVRITLPDVEVNGIVSRGTEIPFQKRTEVFWHTLCQ